MLRWLLNRGSSNLEVLSGDFRIYFRAMRAGKLPVFIKDSNLFYNKESKSYSVFCRKTGKKTFVISAYEVLCISRDAIPSLELNVKSAKGVNQCQS